MFGKVFRAVIFAGVFAAVPCMAQSAPAAEAGFAGVRNGVNARHP